MAMIYFDTYGNRGPYVPFGGGLPYGYSGGGSNQTGGSEQGNSTLKELGKGNDDDGDNGNSGDDKESGNGATGGSGQSSGTLKELGKGNDDDGDNGSGQGSGALEELGKGNDDDGDNGNSGDDKESGNGAADGSEQGNGTLKELGNGDDDAGDKGKRLEGGRGDDWLQGGDGNDRLHGRAGDDDLNGMAGDDVLRGGKGDDNLNGGAGNDTLTGGKGDDVFYFQPADGAGTDTITDFGNGADLIDLMFFQLDSLDGLMTLSDEGVTIDLTGVTVTGTDGVESTGGTILLEGLSSLPDSDSFIL